MPLMQEDGVGLGGDAHAAKPGRQHLQGGDLHPAEVFAVGVGGGADDAIGVLPELARQGKEKEAIAAYLRSHFYDLSRTLAQIRPSYGFTCTTDDSVPEAIECFLEGTDYEDTIRKAIWLNGDTDTQAAIAGSIAEAHYGIPADLREAAMQRLVAAQDTGGAIKGSVRADFFWGTGQAAGELAGTMKQRGNLWLLWPKDSPLP